MGEKNVAKKQQSMSEKKPLFRQGDNVRKATTLELGVVSGEPQLDAGDYWYKISFGKKSEQIPEEELLPLEDNAPTVASLVRSNQWGRLDAFRCAIALEKINDPSRNTVYAFNSQRILFQSYQYKPLLKILDSEDRKLLVADEVGLGKTIEAGLVLTELEARRELGKVLVVCPARLREKWKQELNRKFNQDFEILDRTLLREYIRKHRDNPLKARLRGVVSMTTLRHQNLSEELEREVGNIDLIVVDEAHHARNSETKTSSMLQMLGRVGDCVMLLTATPLHLGNQDLFVLLQALRPTEFHNSSVFESVLERHQPLHLAAKLTRFRDTTNLPRIVGILREVFQTSESGDIANPLARNVISTLERFHPESTRDWVEIERRVQDLHPLSSILTRTKKRDVQQHAPTRRPRVVKCQWNQLEQALYDRLAGNGCRNGWFRHRLSMGQIQRARQAASCLPAALESQSISSIGDSDLNSELIDLEEFDSDERLLEGPTVRNIDAARCTEDTKYKVFRDKIIAEILKNEPDAKILVFSFFRGTVEYLEKKLRNDGIMCVCIHGNIPSTPRHPDKDERERRIQQFRLDSEVRVLISTEVGSEGLDFQFCHHLVNYDLPWNPMTVEQRIGRIDRFGQEADVLHIINLVVEGTVEDRILHRLYERIGVFERSIGDLESILGKEVKHIEQSYLNGTLTPEEADVRVQQAAEAIDRNRMQSEELERRASELFGHEDYINEEINRVSRLGRYMGSDSILAVVKNYLECQHPDASIWESSTDIHTIRLTSRLKEEVARESDEGAFWFRRERSSKYQFTMDGGLSFKRPEIDIVNVSHPLVRAAVGGIRERFQCATARVGFAVLSNKNLEAGLRIHRGAYLIIIYSITVTSLRNRKLLEPIGWDFEKQSVLDADAGELLLNNVCRRGENSIPTSPIAIDQCGAIDSIEREIRARYRRLQQAERDENEAIFLRRSNTLDAEERLKTHNLQQRIATAQGNRSDRAVRMFQGQLDKIRNEFRAKRLSLESLRKVSISLSEPVAACLVEVN